jgi:FtsP/CotA-like multicopper oxidase with cupredoxin domain
LEKTIAIMVALRALKLFVAAILTLPTTVTAQVCNGPNNSPFSTAWTIDFSTNPLTITTASYPDKTATVNNPTSFTTATTASFIRVNQKWPADPIVVKKCTQITIRITNNLSGPASGEPITLHFHGLTQKNGQVVMDGPEGLTQSGVTNGKTFTYRFLADQEGTYWIHSHHGGQYPKGLRAPLVVYNDDDPLNYGYSERANVQDEIITLSDW